jgi:hypothetical protein
MPPKTGYLPTSAFERKLGKKLDPVKMIVSIQEN